MSALALEEASVEIDGRFLVRDATLALERGRLSVFVGPNGSGKTTLMRLLAGLWQPSAGRSTLDGREIRLIGRREMARRVSFVPQDTHLSLAFTVREIVAMGRHPHIARFASETRADARAINAAMERADVSHLAARFVTELSGGERQRTVIARSLATETGAILLDEPTANLDVAHALDVLELCHQLAHEGKTLALATHDLNAAARYGSHIIMLAGGRIVAAGAPAQVLTDETIATVFDVRTERATLAGGSEVFLFRR